MIYEVRHVTRYRYEPPVAANRCTLRLLPRTIDGQDVLASGLEIKPRPTEMDERADVFGNRIVRMRIDAMHRELTIRSTAKVKVERKPPPAPARTSAWEDVASDAAASPSLGADSPAYGLYPSRLAGIYEPITAYARTSFPHSAPIYEAALDLNRRINVDFAYDKTATDVY
ncbi:MAG TPA: transglutaminase N-terminal domain-containing protein, partial [Roseiarcus sp.]|nr:transglutaminase N-terminal domain-containing protein [Roseiarcus sp.]